MMAPKSGWDALRREWVVSCSREAYEMVVLSQTDISNLSDLQVALHPASTQGVPVQSDASTDPRLPQDNGTPQVPEMKRG